MDAKELRGWLISQKFSDDLPRNSEVTSRFNWLIAEVERLTIENAKWYKEGNEFKEAWRECLAAKNAAEGEVESLRVFIAEIRDNMECETTGYEEFETHRPAQCRRCQAEELLATPTKEPE